MQNSLFPSKQSLAVALGTFDGLHRGHRAVIDAALTFGDSGMTPCVLLFDVHPQSVLDGHAPPEILTPAMRDKELEKAGIRTVKIPFESVRHLSAEAFVADVLVNDLGTAAVCCGYDYRFGHDATGNVDTLRELCARFGLRVLIADAVTYKGEAVSSTRIRACIEGGLIEDANEMLGRVFSTILRLSAATVSAVCSALRPSTNTSPTGSRCRKRASTFPARLSMDFGIPRSRTSVCARLLTGKPCAAKPALWIFPGTCTGNMWRSGC
jgi:FAD synthase